MKKLLSILFLLALTMFSLELSAAAPSVVDMETSTDPIHPRDVNRLIKIAADHWSLTVGQARQAYNQGTLLITPYPQGGEDVYMILYDGLCILAALEDKF